MEKNYYYFYKITNTINNKYYYGVHSTNDMNDGYMGSGIALKNAYEKYGKSNFTKTIMRYFVDKEDMYEYEKLIVNKDLINDPLCYNLKTGGEAEYAYTSESIEKNRQSNILAWKEGRNKGTTGNKEFGKHISEIQTGRKLSEDTKRKIGEKAKLRCGEKSPMWGRKLSEETKAKLRRTFSEEHKQKLRKAHKLGKKHWKLVDGKRVWY